MLSDGQIGRVPASSTKVAFTLPQYHILYLARDGAVFSVSTVQYADDAEAMDEATKLLAVHHGVEVWLGERLVGRVSRSNGKV